MKKKGRRNHNDHVKDNEDHDKHEKLVTGTDHEPNQTLQLKNKHRGGVCEHGGSC